ncbi:TCY1 [Auxenochlorella protothecoides x Auxenochlorella symbiontica]
MLLNAAYDTIPRTTTPHSGYHFDGSDRRFFEGWYWRLTLPGRGQSFAVIYSVEDPGSQRPTSGVGAQIMGPNDSYLLQYEEGTAGFWADPHELALGKVFAASPGCAPAAAPCPPERFEALVSEGFQVQGGRHQGRIVSREAGVVPGPAPSVASARWDFQITPRLGWGSPGQRQLSTAGWLAAVPIFEPHWQVLMAHGSASGWIEWGGERYAFQGVPTYAEKNWGGGFPSRWCWVQCNSFDGHPGTSVTAVCARRGVRLVPGLEEDVGLIGLHAAGDFHEFVPNKGDIEWEVEPWGTWRIHGENAEHTALVEASCPLEAGTVLRAPTADLGLAPFCRDSFSGRVRVRMWRRGEEGRAPPVVDCVSLEETGAVEVGGGPWWSGWKARAAMAGGVKALLNLPVDVEGLTGWLPGGLRPKGL